jgi:hypothetical protein
MALYVVCLRLDSAFPLHLYIKCVVSKTVPHINKDLLLLRNCPNKCNLKLNYLHKLLYYVTWLLFLWFMTLLEGTGFVYHVKAKSLGLYSTNSQSLCLTGNQINDQRVTNAPHPNRKFNTQSPPMVFFFVVVCLCASHWIISKVYSKGKFIIKF